ncbi:MAG: hypothetical protein KatS3mg008_0662 [Acidimicrobiales bacterium]|nr:MAG: hypothetical protein KatS3mg008_0662 [Acidimicrobiales bacterium]
MREVIILATLDCILASGFRFTVDEVAARAGVSRASVYRHFPGGREQLLHETVAWEVSSFFTRIAEAVAHVPDLRSRLALALLEGRRLLRGHRLLERVLVEDPETLVAELQLVMPMVFEGVRSYLRPLLEREKLVEGVDTDEAADYLARMFLSHLGSEGLGDLGDPERVRRLVDTRFTAGVLARPEG